MRQSRGSIVCPSCGKLIGISEPTCPFCGAWRPGLFGWAPALQHLFRGRLNLVSLIVATCGGGTGLPTQRECLEVLGCYGPGKARKLAEIVAATVLCGELSLGSAIVADQWVAAHESLGRNPPVDASAVS